MDTDDESQSIGAPTRALTSLELEVLATLDTLEISGPATDAADPTIASPAPVPGRLREAIRQAKTRLANDREARLDEKRKADNAAYADFIMKSEGRTVRGYEARTPERQREIELAKYRAKPKSDQSAKRAARRRRAKATKTEAERPEGFGKF